MNSKKLFVTLMILLFAIFVGTAMFLNLNKNNRASEVSDEPLNVTIENTEGQMETPKEGSLYVYYGAEEGVSAKVGDQVTVDISADSNGKKITGFDAILTYDPSELEFAGTVNPIAEITLYESGGDGRIAITGVRAVSSEPVPFENSIVGQAFFKVLKAGSLNVYVADKDEAGKSDLITDNTEIMNPTTNFVTIEVSE